MNTLSVSLCIAAFFAICFLFFCIFVFITTRRKFSCRISSSEKKFQITKIQCGEFHEVLEFNSKRKAIAFLKKRAGRAGSKIQFDERLRKSLVVAGSNVFIAEFEI